jgi:photosystem II stability/assembly factor-like uncharacterized protein
LFALELGFLALGASAMAHAQTWERLGPEGGMVVSLAAGPGDKVLLGTADGHVFASADAGQSWGLRGRVGARTDAVVTRMVFDAKDGKRIFAAVWYQEAGAGGGVFESEDLGKSWKLVGLQGEAVRAMEMAPSNPAELVAGTRSGVFLSSDSGKSWGRISPEGDEELKNLDSLAIDPRDPQIIYAGTYHLPWLTRDRGKTWKPVIAGIIDDSDIMSLRLDASNPDRVYMSACSGIYRSENEGGEWIKLQGIPYAARRTQVIVQDTANPKTLYAGTTAGLWITRDGGENWARTTSKEWVVNSLAVLPEKNGAPGRVVMGTEGQGVLISNDAGASFAEANRGFTHVIVNRLIADENDPRHLLMLVERDSAEILESRDEGKSWSNLSLNAVERRKVITLNANQVREIYSSPWGWLLWFEDRRFWNWDPGKQSWTQWTPRLPGIPGPARTLDALGAAKSAAKSTSMSTVGPKVEIEAPIVVLEKFAVVATNLGLLRCQVSGDCQRFKAFGRSEQSRALWVSTTGFEIGVVIDGKLAWSSDGGASAQWSDLPLPSDEVLWLDADEAGASKTIYLGTSKGIFFRMEEGSWQRIAGGLPAGQAGRWLRRPGLWAVSERDGGLYISRNEGKTWTRADQDAERGRFTGLVATQDGGVLVGSQSEGLLKCNVR